MRGPGRFGIWVSLNIFCGDYNGVFMPGFVFSNQVDSTEFTSCKGFLTDPTKKFSDPNCTENFGPITNGNQVEIMTFPLYCTENGVVAASCLSVATNAYQPCQIEFDAVISNYTAHYEFHSSNGNCIFL